MNESPLEAQRSHLSNLLEAIQRSVYFLDASERKLSWPLEAEEVRSRKRDVALFESLAAINERFAKLQDTLGSAMRYAAVLAGEPTESFLKVLSFYEKTGVIDSVATWQLYRTTRNLAAHDYETDYAEIAAHFNALHGLLGALYSDASRFLRFSRDELHIEPASADFRDDFRMITEKHA